MNPKDEETDPIVDMIRESGLDAAEYAVVVDALASLRGLVPERAPVPSAELAALISGGVVRPLAPARHLRRRIVVASGTLAATVVLGTGVAAASNLLPEPAQRLLNEFSEKYLPFEIPSPDDRGNGAGGPGGTPGSGTKPTGAKTDRGHHIGGGLGSGETDNLGKHKGADQGAANGEAGQGNGKGGAGGDKPEKEPNPNIGKGDTEPAPGPNPNANPNATENPAEDRPKPPPETGNVNGQKPPPKDQDDDVTPPGGQGGEDAGGKKSDG